MTRTRIFGHRGAPSVLPENTLDGFRHAIDAGVDGLEIDLLVTADGVPVVTHNPVLHHDTTRDASGQWLTQDVAINTLTLEALRTFDVGVARPGSDYAQAHPDQQPRPGTRIPTLEDFLQLVKETGRDIELLVELKHRPQYAPQIAAGDFVQMVGDLLLAHDLAEQSYIHAFNWNILTEARRRHPALRRSYLSATRTAHPHGTVFPGSPWLDGLDPDFAPIPELLGQCDAAVWSPYFKDLTPEDLHLARAEGVQVMTWTVNDPADLQAQLALGLDGIITDVPALALNLRNATSSE